MHDKNRSGERQVPKYDLFTFDQNEGGALHLTQHGEDALNKIFGSESPAVNEALFLQGYMTPQSSEAEDGTTDTRGFLPAIVRDFAPRDGIERMLVVQMATTHIALMRQGGRMAIADQLSLFEAHERACTNLARTYTAQVEALRKHRNGGEQTVTVQTCEYGRRRAGHRWQCSGRGEGNICKVTPTPYPVFRRYYSSSKHL